MMTNSIRSRFTTHRAGFGAVALGAGVALAVVSAPAAAAEVTGVSVTPGESLGATPYGTGCSYEVVANAYDMSAPVYFRDLDSDWASGPVAIVDHISNSTATTTWTPTATGSHTIVAEQWVDYEPYYSSQTTTVQVGTGVDLGSACVAL